MAWTQVLPVSLQTHLPTAPLTASEAVALVSEAPPLPEAVEAAFVTPGGSAQEISEQRAEGELLPTAASVEAEQRPEQAGASQQRQAEPVAQTPQQANWKSHGRAAAAAGILSEDDVADSVSSVTPPPSDVGTQQLMPAVNSSAMAATRNELPLPPVMTGRINCTASGFCR